MPELYANWSEACASTNYDTGRWMVGLVAILVVLGTHNSEEKQK